MLNWPLARVFIALAAIKSGASEGPPRQVGLGRRAERELHVPHHQRQIGFLPYQLAAENGDRNSWLTINLRLGPNTYQFDSISYCMNRRSGSGSTFAASIHELTQSGALLPRAAAAVTAKRAQ